MVKRTDFSEADPVIEQVCTYFDLSREDISRNCRLMEYVQARALVWYRMVYTHGYTLEEAGELFGKRHCTVINGIKKAKMYYRLAYQNIFKEEMKDEMV